MFKRSKYEELNYIVAGIQGWSGCLLQGMVQHVGLSWPLDDQPKPFRYLTIVNCHPPIFDIPKIFRTNTTHPPTTTTSQLIV